MPVEHPALATGAHAVHRLAPGLLLVFKPRGHREAVHAHPHRQRLRVLRGLLRVETARRVVLLDAASHPLTLAAQRRHATEAIADTWLVAESVGSTPRRAAAVRRVKQRSPAR